MTVMQETIKATPGQIEQAITELIPLHVIRTETELSKYPIHNLAKKGTISINIRRRNERGETGEHSIPGVMQLSGPIVLRFVAGSLDTSVETSPPTLH